MLNRLKETRDRQERIDKVMCKGGYTWNETVKRCIPAYDIGKKANSPEDSAQIAADAIAMEAMSRRSGE